MKLTQLAIAIAAALIVASCGDSSSPQSSSKSSQANSIVGTWKDNKSGIKTQFNDDGTLTMTPPGATGKWSMASDGRLNFALVRNGQTVMSQALQLQWNGKDDLTLTDEGGKQMRWTR